MTDPLAARSQPTSTGYREIDVVAAAPLVGAVRVIDVREPAEFDAELGHIRGAELVPQGTVPAASSTWDREVPLLLVCRSGGRSGRAAALLAQAGFTRVYNLTGGMLAWNATNLPVIRGRAGLVPTVQPFFDARTWTLTYVVSDPATKDAVVIDPVLDFDPANGRVWEESLQAVIKHVDENGLRVRAVLETHAHADHLTGAQVLKARYGAPIVIGRDIRAVQEVFAPVFDLDVPTDGSQFDHLLEDGERYKAGSVEVVAIHTPGHTPACLSYRVGDAVFTGDALFMPDYGVGRCDFPAGNAEKLYESVHDKLYALPDDTRVFVGHDYQPGGRPVAWETTIGASKAGNVQLRASTTREEFVKFRTARDATLSAPRLLYPSVQVNIDAGRLPAPRANGRRYLVTPLKLG